MGCLMCYGSKVGWYHRLFLPIIVLELAGGTGGSIWGSIDLCALCMVAAGECCLTEACRYAMYAEPLTITYNRETRLYYLTHTGMLQRL